MDQKVEEQQASLRGLLRTRRRHLLYSDHIDYLIASVIYLSTQPHFWARTPSMLARELTLDETRLRNVFAGFPGIFRRSIRPSSETGEYYYSLQARYAQRNIYMVDEADTEIEPLSTENVRLIYDFVLKSADDERTRYRSLIANGIAVTAAVTSAATAILVAALKVN